MQVPPETARSPDLLRKTSLEHDVEMPKKLEPALQPTQTQPQRPKMNAKERWHWAYNRVVHQINVSTRLLHRTVRATGRTTTRPAAGPC